MSASDQIPALRANWERLLARFGSLPCRRAAPAELTLATPAEAWPEDVPWQRVRDATVDYSWKRRKTAGNRPSRGDRRSKGSERAGRNRRDPARFGEGKP